MGIVANFISKIKGVHKTGAATEHSYRSALEGLFSTLANGVTALNEPKRVACGAPDFIIQRGEIVVGHVEAKDLGIGLRAMKDANKKQQDRYLKALPNLIYTNCLDWDFYRNGELFASVSIAEFHSGIQPKPEQFAALENLLRDFIAQRPQTITSPRTLAEMMAGKAGLIKDVLHNALNADKSQQTELADQYRALREHLIHDISPEDFADIYAETIAYGMFAARLHDLTLDTFSRKEALELLPKSNPFLRSLFGYIAGPDLDSRISWIIDDLADVFQAANVAKLMEGFGRLTGRNDPFLHFYETFLAAYNPEKRKARGVWYTPEPIVNFIVRAVDRVLQTEFGLPDGLADTSKVNIEWDTGQTGKRGKPIYIRKEVHRVQVLDPATGTGTFLAEVIKQIAPKVKGVAEGMWSQYIERDMIPRLHGFELLMASYAMCHMKLDMILTELNYKPAGQPPRLSVFLTNSLEEGEPPNQSLPFAQWLSNEVKQANSIKRDMPIMCVIGNPPYSGESANKGEWIMRLLEAYKMEPGGVERLNERNPKWINDDYVKFIRFSEHLIERNGEGVLGLITNHGYLDNPTFRGMRWHLLNAFDRLYVLDLHGNTKKKETTPEGTPDKNVFDIQQGVSILIGVKKRTVSDSKSLAEIFHGELWGERESKYQKLWSSDLSSDLWKKLEPRAPHYMFVRRQHVLDAKFRAGFGIQEFMPVNSVGIVTARDGLTVDIESQKLWERVRDFAQLDPDEAREKYALAKDAQDWTIQSAQFDVNSHLSFENLVPFAYRPFDTRWTFYTGVSRGFHCRPRSDVMRHLLGRANIGLGVCRQGGVNQWAHVSICNTIVDDSYISNRSRERGYVAPLYLYPDKSELDQTRRVNFDPKLFSQLQLLATDSDRGLPDELATFDYIYGVLHCPSYRAMYAEFLKTEFPRIPWPSSPEEFWQVSSKGNALRRLHLMEIDVVGATPYPLRGHGTSLVSNPRFESRKVWINDNQYFDSVPDEAWSFYVGAYQPALTWLKSRKNRTLSFDDVKHYQRIIKILAETNRIMGTITMTL